MVSNDHGHTLGPLSYVLVLYGSSERKPKRKIEKNDSEGREGLGEKDQKSMPAGL